MSQKIQLPRLHKLICLALVPSALAIWSTSALGLDFEVKEVKGEVTYLDRFSGEFVPVKKAMILSSGMMIQVGLKSFIKLDSGENADAAPDMPRALEVRRPMLLRIPESLRAISQGEYALKELPKGGGDAATVKPVMMWSEGWSRLIAVLKNPREKRKVKSTKTEPFDGDVSTASSLGVVKWQLPIGDIAIVSDRMPVLVDLLWQQEVVHGGQYKVYVWPRQETKPDPVSVVTNDSFQVQIPKDGTFFVEIASADGKYRSSRRQVKVSLPGRRGEGVRPPEGFVVSRIERSNIDLSPGFGALVYGQGPVNPVTFSWNFRTNVVGSKAYELTVNRVNRGPKEKPLYRTTVLGNSLSYNLPGFGDFEWSVAEIESKDGEVIGKVEGPLQKLRFQKYESEAVIMKDFLQKVSAGEKAVVEFPR